MAEKKGSFMPAMSVVPYPVVVRRDTTVNSEFRKTASGEIVEDPEERR